MKTLLVTGASGFLGSLLCQRAASEFAVYGAGFRRAPAIPEVRGLQVDLSDQDAVARVFDAIEPQAVIHAGAQANPAECERAPEAARAANVQAVGVVASLCGERGLPLVFASTDMVFDGRNAPYAEDARPSPLGFYGQLKAEAEALTLALCPQACVCRLPLLFGVSELEATPRAGNFFLTMARALTQGAPLRLFSDEFRTPLYAPDAAQGLLLALNSLSAPGRTLHLAGPQRVSRYEFGRLLAEAMGRDASGFTPLTLAQAGLADSRPADLALLAERARALGFAPRPLPEAVGLAAEDALKALGLKAHKHR